ncbi:oligosaccharide flippase family protein [Chlorogloeopsis sp. ULAP01]|jgi:O-antigen/teichoic acid export membrane protein|uniref:oligosaccharide flippase family protein n=1 Tax=Chlorogloeopsis sp. ULAP01 TaxID=3056483 RepID=UPI0025AAEE75|nr:oligosaccharide flippase family protein [Chlorogloeopsis sp. ULAP01]MDM9383471.1 oligosaccharide flippase family protein [Chlorogloeopsis sp. ULAP01]
MKLDKFKLLIDRLVQNSLARNTLWMLFAQGLSLVLQAGYFVIIVRVLGVEEYGAFVGATALVAILAPFATLGSGNLLIKNVSRNRALFGEYWGNALFMIFASGSALILFVLLIAPFILPKTIPPLLVFLVAVTDLIFHRTLGTAGQAFQAVLWLSKTALLNVLPNITRLIAALALASFFSNPNALEWTFLYLSSTAVSTVIGVLLVHRNLGTPKLALSRIKPEIVEGFYFSVSFSAQTIYNDIDKTMLARLATLEATGIYAAAYRLIDVAFVPVRAILAAAYAKFFQRGVTGISGTIAFSKRLLPIAGIYGAIAGIVTFLLAPAVPYVLGDEYAGTVEALRWLAPLLFLRAMHYFAADTLTGAGFQGMRSVIQVIVAVFNVLVNLWLIPLYSWRGSAWSSLASDTFLMLGLGVLVAFLYQRQIKRLENQ